MHSRDSDAAHAAFRLAALRSALRNGAAVSDRAFDSALLPVQFRWRSSTFWTPVDVARRAVELLAITRAMRVLDVGSGVGKFCIIGAATTGALFVGVERRAHLVDVAISAAARAQAMTARFSHADFSAVDIETFDAVYLFNPFEENVWGPDERLDDTVPLSFARAREDVACAEKMLARARPGTRVVTYHGFGGDMPTSYKHLLSEPRGSGYLDLWIQSS